MDIRSVGVMAVSLWYQVMFGAGNPVAEQERTMLSSIRVTLMDTGFSTTSGLTVLREHIRKLITNREHYIPLRETVADSFPAWFDTVHS